MNLPTGNGNERNADREFQPPVSIVCVLSCSRATRVWTVLWSCVSLWFHTKYVAGWSPLSVQVCTSRLQGLLNCCWIVQEKIPIYSVVVWHVSWWPLIYFTWWFPIILQWDQGRKTSSRCSGRKVQKVNPRNRRLLVATAASREPAPTALQTSTSW